MLLRSFLFLPAYRRRYIDKALDSEADAVILDIEDSVSANRKSEAREVVKEYSKKGALNSKNVFIRINPIGSRDFVYDMSELIIDGINGIMPSKIETAEDIVFLDKLLSFLEIKNSMEEGALKIAPLIETTKAVENISEIAKASKRLVALCFGGEDYLNELGSVYMYQEAAFVVPRALLVNAARANNLLPIDTPFLNISDLEGFENAGRQAYKNGFAGNLLVNPKQINIANSVYYPDEEKIEHAKRIINAVNESQNQNEANIVMLDGQMVGPPMRKRAENVIRQIID